MPKLNNKGSPQQASSGPDHHLMRGSRYDSCRGAGPVGNTEGIEAQRAPLLCGTLVKGDRGDRTGTDFRELPS